MKDAVDVHLQNLRRGEIMGCSAMVKALMEQQSPAVIAIALDALDGGLDSFVNFIKQNCTPGSDSKMSESWMPFMESMPTVTGANRMAYGNAWDRVANDVESILQEQGPDVVEDLQRNHSLAVDGYAGPNTLEAVMSNPPVHRWESRTLNLPAESKTLHFNIGPQGLWVMTHFPFITRKDGKEFGPEVAYIMQELSSCRTMTRGHIRPFSLSKLLLQRLPAETVILPNGTITFNLIEPLDYDIEVTLFGYVSVPQLESKT